MKRSVQILILVSLTLLSCGSDGSEMEEFVAAEEMMMKEFSGNFVADTHPTSGTVVVNKEQTELLLENFKTDDGPRLLLYLSTSVESMDFVNLGDLQGVEGDFTYEIPKDTDLDKYKFVVVWCVDFLVSFGHAELK